MGAVIRRYIARVPHNITYPYSTCISSFLAVASLATSLFIFKCFFVLAIHIYS